MNKTFRLLAYAAMTASVMYGAMTLQAQAPSSLVNRVPAPAITDKNGAAQVNTSGVNNTYGAAAIGVTPASGAWDVACIKGSATKSVHLTRVSIAGTASPQYNGPVLLLKRKSVNTTGTYATTGVPSPYAYWSSNPTATAQVTSYTANPTNADSSPGVIAAAIVSLVQNLVTSTVNQPNTVFDFGNRGGAGQPSLLSSSEQMCVSLNGQTPVSALLYIHFEWTED